MNLKLAYKDGVCTGLILIIAARGHGKSTLAETLLNGEYFAPKEKVILVDVQGTLAAKTGIKRYQVNPEKDDVNAFLNTVLRPAEKAGSGVFIVIDDFDRLTTQRGIYTGGQSGQLWEAINVARGWGVGMMLMAHSEVQLHNAVTNADVIFIGNVGEASSVKYWRGVTGDPELVEVLRRLPPHVFMVWARTMAPNQFQGFVTVDDGKIRELTKDEFRTFLDGKRPEWDDKDEEPPQEEIDEPEESDAV